jgi:hypothetical protein
MLMDNRGVRNEARSALHFHPLRANSPVRKPLPRSLGQTVGGTARQWANAAPMGMAGLGWCGRLRLSARRINCFTLGGSTAEQHDNQSSRKNMIKGVHTMFFSSQPTELRSFIRDKLGFPFTDVGEGWLIFDLPEAEMGCHLADPAEGQPAGTHNISFYCDDIHDTVGELQRRGVEFTGGISDRGYGFVTFFKMPGGIEAQLYQPRYSKKPHKG